MKITIHRGLNQIGGCITEIQSLSGTKILIDFGHNLPNGNDAAEDVYECPENVDELLKECSAVLYTHYHGDHLGFTAEVHKRGVPQYMGPLAIRMMLHLNRHMTFAESLKARAESNLEALNEFRSFSVLDKVHIGDISITPFSVSHSAPDSYMFLIECDGMKILHTGDFRDHGYLGKGLYSMLEKYIIPAGIDILITEGTNIGQASKSVISEQKVCSDLRNVMKHYKNVFVLCSSADADRLWSIHEATSDSHRPLLCDEYQKIMLELFRDNFDPKGPLYRFKVEDIFSIKNYRENTKLVKWINRSGFVMVIRSSETFQKYLDEVLPYCKPEETCLVYSMFKGYIDPNHKAYNPTLHSFVNQFPRHVICHTSGHASKECLEKVCTLIDPSLAIIPIHKEDTFDKLDLPIQIKSTIYNSSIMTTAF